MTQFANVAAFFPAVVAILNANAALRTLFGRTTALCIPWDTLEKNTAIPVIAYHGLDGTNSWEGTDVLQIQLSCWARSQVTTDQAIAIACNALTLPAFKVQGVDCAPQPGVRPRLTWPGADTEQGDPAEARSDASLSFLITG